MLLPSCVQRASVVMQWMISSWWAKTPTDSRHRWSDDHRPWRPQNVQPSWPQPDQADQAVASKIQWWSMIGAKKLGSVGKIWENTSKYIKIMKQNASNLLRKKSQRITSKKRYNEDEGFEINSQSYTAGFPMTKDYIRCLDTWHRLWPCKSCKIAMNAWICCFHVWQL